jgi:hypothetical protein
MKSSRLGRQQFFDSYEPGFVFVSVQYSWTMRRQATGVEDPTQDDVDLFEAAFGDKFAERQEIILGDPGEGCQRIL